MILNILFQFLIGTVLHFLGGILSWQKKMFQFLIGTVLLNLTVKPRKLSQEKFQFLIGTVLQINMKEILRKILFQFLIGTVLPAGEVQNYNYTASFRFNSL